MREAMLIVHFIGLGMGLGTSFGMMFLGIASSKMEPAEGKKFMMNASVLGTMGHIGLGLLILSGGYLMNNYWSVLSYMPWMIAKLVLVGILAILIGIMGSTTRKVRKGASPELMAKVKPLGQVAMLVALSIVFCAVMNFH